MRTHLPLLIVLALTATGCAVSPTPSDDVVIGEKLIAQPPTDWQNIYSLNNGTTRLTDFIPPEETKNNWSTKISFESHKSLADVDPITIVMGDLDHTSDTCEAVQSFNLFSGVENNYPTSVRLTFCGKNAHSQQGEVSMTKSIQGNEYLYIIKMLTRVEPFVTEQSSITKQQIAVWSQYFSDISVCDDTSQEHACPAPAEP
tara:strand:- start:9106 stop:9708 length:603 start_codon:yes stop_codon:yes gene_type:complete